MNRFFFIDVDDTLSPPTGKLPIGKPFHGTQAFHLDAIATVMVDSPPGTEGTRVIVVLKQDGRAIVMYTPILPGIVIAQLRSAGGCMP